MFYDVIDMRNNYNRGFWIGAVSSFTLTLILFAGIGLYLTD